MATKHAALETTLRITRTFSSPREIVFQAWTDPEEMKKWFCPAGFTVPSVDVDLRVGGKYRLAMKSPEGRVFDHYGTYREIRPPVKLVYTWILDGQSCDGGESAAGETLVTVEFRDLGGSTELALTHEFFPDENTRENHRWGWNGCLDHLAAIV